MTVVLVTGGRNASAEVRRAVARELTRRAPTRVLVGDAKGVDEAARLWCAAHDVQCDRYDADWTTRGNAAGPTRNAAMCKAAAMLSREGYTVVVLAFPGGRGTADCRRRAHAAGLTVEEVGL